MNNRERAFVLCLVLAALLPFLSWVLSALAVPCRSILDGEGLRWLFRHASDCLHSRLVMLVLCLQMLIGAIQKSLLPLGKTISQPRLLRYAAVAVVVLILILLASVAPDSPLLSITGGIADSPLLEGLPFLAWLSLMAFCLCYGHSKREPWIGMLTHGIRRYPHAIPFAVVVSFCWQCVEYMISS